MFARLVYGIGVVRCLGEGSLGAMLLLFLSRERKEEAAQTDKVHTSSSSSSLLHPGLLQVFLSLGDHLKEDRGLPSPSPFLTPSLSLRITRTCR